MIGFVTGTVTAISAGSGMTVVVPLLTMLVGADIHSAIGTSLLVDVIASIFVAYQYYRHGRVNLKSGLWLALGAVIGAQIGSNFANLIHEEGLEGAFSIFIILTGLSFFYRAFGKKKLTLPWTIFKTDNQRRIATLVIGLYLGVSLGLFGAGGGATILLVLVYLLDYPIHTAIGTATALMAVSAISGSTGYALQGHVLWLEGILIGLAAMVSGMLFSRLANRSSEKSLNAAIGAIFILIGIAMFFVEGGTGGIMTTLQSLRRIVPVN